MVAGKARPLMRAARVCPEIHGSTGLDTKPPQSPDERPLPQWPSIDLDRELRHSGESFLLFMYRTICNEPHGRKTTVIATGCLTNIALLLTVFPDVSHHIEAIVLMGGAIGLGNTSPAAEWNIEIDPEAAAIVFQSACEPAATDDGSSGRSGFERHPVPIRVVQVPLEVTHTVLVTPEVLAEVRELQSEYSRLLAALLVFFQDSYLSTFGFEHPPLHDPVAVAYVIAPELFTVKRLRVDIETTSALCSGRTIVDVHGITGRTPQIDVALTVNVNAFWALLLDAIRRADRVSCLNSNH